MAAPLFLCLYITDIAAQALLRVRPALRSEPVAVLEGTPPLEIVAAANPAAQKLGVARGMRKSELGSFPHLSVLRRSEAQERTARAAVFDVVGTLTPRIEEQHCDRSPGSQCGCSLASRSAGSLPTKATQPTSRSGSGPVRGSVRIVASKQSTCRPSDPGALVLGLDITGSERLFGPPLAIARLLLQGLRSIGIDARCAGSSNLPAALCFARAATRRITVVSHQQTAAALAPLPLSALALSPDQADTLSIWGLRTVGELAALPTLDLVSRLGQDGERLSFLARGEAKHFLVPEEPGFSLEETTQFDSPVDTIDSLLFVLGPMLDALLARAGARALGLASLTTHLQLEGGGAHTRTLKPALPVSDRILLLKLLQLDLAAHPPPAGVLIVTVTAEPGVRSNVQSGLFSPQTPEPLRLEVTLARLAALVGEGRVGRPQLADSHAPNSFSVQRFTSPEGPAAKKPPSRFPGPRSALPLAEQRPRPRDSRPGIALPAPPSAHQHPSSPRGRPALRLPFRGHTLRRPPTFRSLAAKRSLVVWRHLVSRRMGHCRREHQRVCRMQPALPDQPRPLARSLATGRYV